MKEKHKIILTILASLPNDIALTSRDILKEMEPSDQGAFLGIDDITKTLDYLRRKSWVKNGSSEIVKGRTFLTWKIAQPGLNVIGSDIPEAENQQEEKTTTDSTALDQGEGSIAAEMLKELGFLILDPDDELDLPFIQIISALRETYGRPEPVTIARKTEKLSTLQRLGALMSDDIRTVFDDIVSDLEKLDAVP